MGTDSYGEKYLKSFSRIFNQTNFVRLILASRDVNTNDTQSLYEYTAGWLNFASTIKDSEIKVIKTSTGAYKEIGWFKFGNKFLDLVVDNKTFGFGKLTNASRRIILSSVTKGLITGILGVCYE